MVACAPGGLERVEFRDHDGTPRRVEFPRGVTRTQVYERIGPPTSVLQRENSPRVYWLYAFEGSRIDYLFVFKTGEGLQRIQYQPRRGEPP